ncbi:hypothetical protein SBO82_18745 [Alcaligenes nematophilus]|uniref:hypothetical protein n=1 Tax=Alcaligenes nematophilus TaxID=2994643 RepID=UPI002463C7E8|nr:hypothetical protein [Alcaligenes nematophilus]MDH4869003.1 hypothetical protein [Bacillus cereus]MDY7130321.1 hypothetical protein [Alcaligenes nematophilus]
MSRSISRTKAFRKLQKTIGGATLHLNTVAVGLELMVAQPVVTPIGLHISWSSPANEEKRRELVTQSRAFVLRSVLVAACDALDAFLIQFVKTDWLLFSSDVESKVTKATTGPQKKAWSIEDRLSAIASELALMDVCGVKEEIGLMSLAVRWRNAIVHTSSAEFKLEPSIKSLLEKEETINYLMSKAGFNCEVALRNFLNEKSPTLKEATTILAFMQDICRKLDQAAIRRVGGSVEEVEGLLISRLRERFRSRRQLYEFWGVHRRSEWLIDGQEPPSNSHEKDLRRKLSEREKEELDRRSKLFEKKWCSKFGNLISEMGFVEIEGEGNVSAVLCDENINRLMNMSASEFAVAIELE